MLKANMVRILSIGVLALALALVPEPADAKPKDGVPIVAVGLNMLVFQDTSNLSMSSEQMQNLGFDIGVYYRLAMMDLGLRVGHMGPGTFQPDNFGGPFMGRAKGVSQLLVEADLRWRIEDKQWGGYFVALSFGYAGTLSSDAMLNQPRNEFFEVPIERFNSGIGISISSGVLIYASDRILVPLRVGMHRTFASEAGENFSVLTLWLGTGVEFAP